MSHAGRLGNPARCRIYNEPLSIAVSRCHARLPSISFIAMVASSRDPIVAHFSGSRLAIACNAFEHGMRSNPDLKAL